MYIWVNNYKMDTSILTQKGQLLIPKRLRTKYGINAGVKIIFEETETGVIIKPMNEGYFDAYAGILKGSGSLKADIKQARDEEKKAEEHKFKKLK